MFSYRQKHHVDVAEPLVADGKASKAYSFQGLHRDRVGLYWGLQAILTCFNLWLGCRRPERFCWLTTQRLLVPSEGRSVQAEVYVSTLDPLGSQAFEGGV